MSRYIDADAIDYDDYWWHRGYTAQECKQAERLVNEQPTADVVEVVRCKDCDYSMGTTEKKCPMWENIGDPNGYCKWRQSTTIFHK